MKERLSDIVEERLAIAKESLCELIENDAARMFGLPETLEGRALAMDAIRRVTADDSNGLCDICGKPEEGHGLGPDNANLHLFEKVEDESSSDPT